MKRVTQALLLGLSLGVANIVAAESFKEQSNWVVTEAYPSGNQLSSTATALPENFKEQSAWVTTVPSNGPSQCAASSFRSNPTRGATALSNRFNDSSSNAC